MRFPDRAIVDRIRTQYPPGTKVELIRMDDKFAPPVGTMGVVQGVDDSGSLMVAWQNGSHLHIVFGVDEVIRL